MEKTWIQILNKMRSYKIQNGKNEEFMLIEMMWYVLNAIATVCFFSLTEWVSVDDVCIKVKSSEAYSSGVNM